jgi:carbon storage regulator
MLVLSRQRDETIMIGDAIEITVVDVRGDKVRLGITAPTSVAVHRKEVYEAIQRENRNAATIGRDDMRSLARDAAQRSVTPTTAAAARARTAELIRPVRDESPERPDTRDAHTIG